MSAADLCAVCFARNHHVCLVCGNKYNTIEACEMHQRNRNHYSGHFLLAEVARVVRLPSRYDDGAPDANDVAAENGDAAAAAQYDAEVEDGLVASSLRWAARTFLSIMTAMTTTMMTSVLPPELRSSRMSQSIPHRCETSPRFATSRWPNASESVMVKTARTTTTSVLTSRRGCDARSKHILTSRSTTTSLHSNARATCRSGALFLVRA